MSAGKLIWAAMSTAIAFALNLQLRPHFEAAYERTQSTDSHGALVLGSPELEVPSLGAHVVVEDFVHMGKLYRVRELSVRSQQPRGAVPSFELFAALPDSLGLVAGRRSSPRALLQLELPIQETGRLGARESFVQRSANEAGRVVTGRLQFTDIRDVEENGQAGVRGEARVELQVETASGVQMLTGRWTGRIHWE